jgi:hypothetical protein
VIGVILMVAITVILAAVVGSFVFVIGDLGDTAPRASLESDERVVFLDSRSSNGPKSGETYNLTEVRLTHAGGAVLPIETTEIVVEGNRTVLGFENGRFQRLGGDDAECEECIALRPQPESVPDTTDLDPFSSGETWSVLTYQRPSQSLTLNDSFAPSGFYTPKHRRGYVDQFIVPCFSDRGDYNDGGCSRMPSHAKTTPLDAGDDVHVVWEAASGGKTQTLFKYRVQTRPPFFEG